MTVFWIAAAALVLLALAVLGVPLLRGGRVPAAAGDARHTNLALHRAQLQQLDADLAAGAIAADDHARTRTELARRVLEEEEAAAVRPITAGSPRGTLGALLIMVPLLAAALYAWLGTPEGLSPQAASAPREHSQQDVAVMVERLAERMEKQPPGRAEDVEGWVMLARSYGMMQRYGDAVRAYGRALQLAPDNAALMADQADMLAMQQGRSLKGEPMQIIERALRADPNNLKALALAGTGAFDEQDYAGAVRYWERARPLAPPDSEFAKGLERSLAEARALAGGGTPSAAAGSVAGAAPKAAAGGGATPPAAQAAQQQAEATTAAQAPAASIRGRVSLAPALASRVAPDDTVYVFARATEGPKAPLAIVRRSARDLPFDFTLDDSSSMSPQTRLSGFQSVIVGARISKSGQAMGQSGDLQGQAGPVPNRGVSVDLVVDSVRP